MATKIGMCPYCENIRVDSRFFVVNPDASICFCPVCMREMEPEVAINKRNDFINELLTKANKTLYISCNPALAYQCYADVLEYDNENVDAFLGRLLSLIYMSKLRKSYFNEARLLLERNFSENVHKSNEALRYIAFLRKINRVIDEYLYAVQKKLMFKRYYFDAHCLELYLYHVAEAISLKETLSSEASHLKRRFGVDSADVLINLLDHDIDEKRKIVSEKEFVVADGNHYKVASIKKNKTVELALIPNKITDTKLSRYRLSTLDSENKELRYINDIVFKDYSVLIRREKTFLAFGIIFFIMTLACGVLAFVFKENLPLLLAFAIAGGVLFILHFVSSVAHSSNRLLIKKRRMEIA